jgi:polysaccharide chain length determinant protein (PEP-CTERM system associated)
MSINEPLTSRPEFSGRSLLRSVWKQKLLWMLTWVAVSGAALFVVRRLPATYQAETLIQVEEPSVSAKYLAVTAGPDPQDRLTTLSQEILSYNHLLGMIQELNLYPNERRTEPADEVVARMRKDLTIRLERGWSRERTSAFRVTYEGRDPKVVAQVANQIASLFIEGDVRTRKVQADGASDLVETEFTKAKERLQKLEQALTGYKVQYSGELPQQEQALTASLGRLQLQLQSVQDSVSRTEQTEILLRHSLNSAQATEAALARIAIAESAARRSAAVVPPPPRPPKKSETLKADFEALRARYSPNHPEIKRLQTEIERLERLEEAERQATASAAASEPDTPPAAVSAAASEPATQGAEILIRERERVEELKSQLGIAAKQLDSLKVERDRILQEIGEHQRRLDKLPLREQQLAALMRDYEISKANYQSLLDKKLAADMAADVERRKPSETFSVVDPARVPHRPIKPNRPLLAGLGSAFGLVLGLLLALANEWRRDVFLGEWELPPQAFVLGRVPRMDPGHFEGEPKTSQAA